MLKASKWVIQNLVLPEDKNLSVNKCKDTWLRESGHVKAIGQNAGPTSP